MTGRRYLESAAKELFEPALVGRLPVSSEETVLVDAEDAALSAAISLKRIADVLERVAGPDNIKVLARILKGD